MRFFEEFVTLSDKVTKFNFVRIAYLIAIAQSRLVIDRTIFNKTHECGAPPYLASKFVRIDDFTLRWLIRYGKKDVEECFP